MMPTEEIKVLLLKNNETVAKIQNYVRNSEEYKNLLKNAALTSEFKNFFEFLFGYRPLDDDIMKFINKVLNVNLLDNSNPSSNLTSDNIFFVYDTIKDLILEIKVRFPFEKMEKLFVKKMQESSAFRRLVSRMNSKKAKQLFSTIFDTPEVCKLMKVSNENNVPIMDILTFVPFPFGLMFNPKSYTIFTYTEE